MLLIDMSQADIERLGEAALDILERVGGMFQNAEILRALEAAGAVVDHSAETARFPKNMTHDFVAALREEAASESSSGGSHRSSFPGWWTPAMSSAASGSSSDGPRPLRAPKLPSLEVQVAQFRYDLERDEARPGGREDLIEFTKFGDVLHRDQGVGHSLLLREVPPLLEPLEAALVLAEYAHVPGQVFAWEVRQIPYLETMGRILGKDDLFTLGSICIAHPLRFDRSVAERTLEMAKRNQHIGLTAMPVVGMSTPVTMEGFIAMVSAEMLACWITGRAINPGVPLGGDMWAGAPDMKTGTVSFSGFDAMLHSIAVTQFLKRWCGIEVMVGGGEYSDARRPGMYAAMEKAHKAMTIAAFTGHYPMIGQGMLDRGKTLSDVQLLLERDMQAGLNQYARGIEVTDENIAFADMERIDIRMGGNFLATDHTAAHFRQSLWLPEFIDRAGWNGLTSEEAMLRRLREKSRALVSQYKKPEGRNEQLTALRQVVERAREELLGN